MTQLASEQEVTEMKMSLREVIAWCWLSSKTCNQGEDEQCKSGTFMWGVLITAIFFLPMAQVAWVFLCVVRCLTC